MTHTVFVDGEAGTSGLDVLRRLQSRPDPQLILPRDRRRAPKRPTACGAPPAAQRANRLKAGTRDLPTAPAGGAFCGFVLRTTAHRRDDEFHPAVLDGTVDFVL